MTTLPDRPERPAIGRDLLRQHREAVGAAIEAKASGPEELVIQSWRRSAELHRIDVESREPPQLLAASQVRRSREPIESVILAAQPELDRLHRIVGEAGYVTLFCGMSGVAVDCRGSDGRSSEFRYWGTWLGGVWSEAAEGTNGIGTCIAENRPVTVHQSQHFRARHIGLSCSGAPVFGADGQPVAILDVSSIDPQLSQQAHALTLPLVVHSARMIEERLFREGFAREWIIAIAPRAGEPASCLAVDRCHRVVGADRYARKQFNLDQRALEMGRDVSSLFERTGTTPLLRRVAFSDYPVRLRTVRGGETLFALISPPIVSARVPVRKVESALLMQPRLPVLDDLLRHFGTEVPRGGLAPAALRRVEEYVAAHLAENLQIDTLAAQAGLSVHHFARAFKASVGTPPHRYLLRQRVLRAAELLAGSAQPIASVASLVGFSDQSHFTRSFRSVIGLTPGQFRRTHR